MAGYYPDVPANRWAYHLDGTTVLLKDGANSLTNITASAANINDEDQGGGVYVTGKNSIIFMFPEMRNLQAYFASVYNNASAITPYALEISSDTTNGLDGVWSTVVNPWSLVNGSTIPQYRQSINGVSATNVKAARFNFSTATYTHEIRSLHLYGTIPVTETPDRLIFWEPVNENPTPGAWFDWGDSPVGTAQTKQFRIKNNSSTLTANSIDLTSGAATYSMAVEFSSDNVSFASSINIGSLGPSATSSVLYVRRTVPTTEPLRVQAIRMNAVAASWS